MTSERIKVSVPQNEYVAALSALTNILSHNDNNSDDDDNDNDDKSSSPHKQQIKSSILSTIQQTIEPIPNSAFENMEIFGSTPIKRQLHKSLDDSEDISLSSCSTDEMDQEEDRNDSIDSDVELEEDELLDEDVYSKVKEMRNKVRMASLNLQKVREKKMEETLRGVTAEVDDLIRFENELEQQIKLRDGDYNGNDESKVNLKANVADLEVALISLKERLDEMDGLLPDKLQGIKDTIESVSNSLRKKMNKEYSATEKAIQSRDCDDVWRRNSALEQNNCTGVNPENSQGMTDEGSNENNTEPMGAAERFAMFVSNS